MASGDFSIGSSVWPGVSKVVEEVGELGQVIGKLMAVAGAAKHWSGDLREKMIEEMGDVYAALDFVAEHCFSYEEGQLIATRRNKKLATFEKWHQNPESPADPPADP
jgi:hypothetical protein